MPAEPSAEVCGCADAVSKDGHIDEDAGDVDVQRRGVFDGEDGAAGLWCEDGTDTFGAMLEVAFVRRVGRHLDDVDLPLAAGCVTNPEMPLQATFGRVGKVAKLQSVRRKLGGDGKAIG